MGSYKVHQRVNRFFFWQKSGIKKRKAVGEPTAFFFNFVRCFSGSRVNDSLFFECFNFSGKRLYFFVAVVYEFFNRLLICRGEFLKKFFNKFFRLFASEHIRRLFAVLSVQPLWNTYSCSNKSYKRNDQPEDLA